jgi:hypothetical protein
MWRPLEWLSHMKGFKVEPHQVDPRAWDVLDDERHVIGKVDDLVVDTARMVAVYLAVELDTKQFGRRDDPYVLVPMSVAQRDGHHHRLLVPRFTAQGIAELQDARARHEAAFWSQWWSARTTSVDDLRQALAGVKVGEELRIPAGDDEIIVERRPIAASTVTAAVEPEPVIDEPAVATREVNHG